MSKYTTQHHDPAGPAPSRQRGVTLMELMIVVVIVGILASVAFPSFKAYVDRAKRAEAKALLMEAAARQERYYFDNNRYTTTFTDLGYTPTTDGCPAAQPCSDEENYTLSLADGATNSIATSYQLTATPRPPHYDEKCTTLVIDSRGAQSSTGTTANDPICWGK